MNTGIDIGKAIWREPGKDHIYCLISSEGDDEFIIAPFRKQGDTIRLKGTISLCGDSSVNDFFKDVRLNKTPGKYSTPESIYFGNVQKAIAEINAGHFEKVVVARQYYIDKPVDLQTLFNRLVSEYKGAFVYCFMLADGTCMIGATPETLLTRKNGTLVTEALGGTGQVNGYGEKEYLEHRQVIEDIDHKLNVNTYAFDRSETRIKIAGNISHLSTIFNVKSKDMESDLSLLKVLHPTSAVCGLPFLPAFNFIEQYEDFNRGYYSGFLGIKKTSDFNFYVNLRCAGVFKDGAMLYAGAGINKDSIPENEWLETTSKLNTLSKWML